jgi:hypothetical protein
VAQASLLAVADEGDRIGPNFAASQESGSGPSATLLDVRCLVAIGGKADIAI